MYDSIDGLLYAFVGGITLSGQVLRFGLGSEVFIGKLLDVSIIYDRLFCFVFRNAETQGSMNAYCWGRGSATQTKIGQE